MDFLHGTIEFAPNIVDTINASRDRILSKWFGHIAPEDKTTILKKEIKSLLDDATKATDQFSNIFAGKENIILFLRGNEYECFSARLSRQNVNKTGDEVHIYRYAPEPNGGPHANGESSIVRIEIGFLMLGKPESSTIWVNLCGESEKNNQDVNFDFVGECAANGITDEMRNSLNVDQRNEMGMFTNGEAMLAMRELRQNPIDEMTLAITEKILNSGERMTPKELNNQISEFEKKTKAFSNQ